MVKETLRRSFGGVGTTYEAVRPDYSKRLIDDIIRISGIPNNGNILEIGGGTGKATLPFAQKGYNITLVDISEELIRIAKRGLRQFPKMRYIVSPFENAKLPKERFDLVIAAQSLHWVKPEFRFKKTWEILKEDGYLAAFSNFHTQEAEPERQIKGLYLEYCPDYPGVGHQALRRVQNQFSESNLFKRVKRRDYKRDIEYSRDKYLGLVNSFSWVSTLPQGKRRQLISRIGEVLGSRRIVTVPTETVLLIARKE
jgi:ubiquinone/menaquinone biosynthesis C-methylase UbiE